MISMVSVVIAIYIVERLYYLCHVVVHSDFSLLAVILVSKLQPDFWLLLNLSLAPDQETILRCNIIVLLSIFIVLLKNSLQLIQVHMLPTQH